MISPKLAHEWYKALLKKNSDFEGVFFVAVKTTGIFCRPTCPARKPRFENCEFYKAAKEALLGGFRPCLRCKPLSHPSQASKLIQSLVKAVESDPAKRWRESDFDLLSVDASTARRHFKKRFGMTFVEYARARRMGLAMRQMRDGETIIDTQLNTGYESSSGFRDAFSKIMGAPPTKLNQNHVKLKSAQLDTPLRPMIAIADEEALYLLEFVSRRGLEREIEKLRVNAVIVPGSTKVLTSIEKEIKNYFEGKLFEFKTPLITSGSFFQKKVWQELLRIPYGQTRSYPAQANAIGNPKSYRAVANANGANQFAIVIPCHRIINNNGDLGGYGGGIVRKQWLLDFEKKHKKNMD